MSNFLDRLALAKAGYKKSEIEELLSETVEDSTTTTADNLTNEGQTDESAVDTTDGGAEAEKEEEHAEQTDVPDYKALYEKACADLKKAQEKNTHVNVESQAPKKPDIDSILDSLMK